MPPLILSPIDDRHIRHQHLHEKRARSHQHINSSSSHHSNGQHQQPHQQQTQQTQQKSLHNISYTKEQQPPSHRPHRFNVQRVNFPSNSDDSDESAKTLPGHSMA